MTDRIVDTDPAEPVSMRLAERGLELLWTMVAALLIAAAALVTMVRMLLPEIGSQRDAIEAWLSDAVGRDAEVGSIEARWQGWAPRIVVEDLVLRDPVTADELLRFDRATVSIAPLGSLATRGLKPKRLVLSGVELGVIRHHDGRYSIAGMPPARSPIVRWLLEQDNFAVTEADLTLIDERGGASFALSDLRISVRARAGRTHLSAYVDLPDAIGERAALTLDASANPVTSDWSGTLAVRLDGVDSRFLAAHLGDGKAVPPAATVDLTAWSEWRDAAMAGARFEFALSRPSETTRRAEPLLGGRGELLRDAAGWQLASSDLRLPQALTDAPPPSLVLAWRASAARARTVVGRATSIPLATLATLFAALGEAPALPVAIDTGRLDTLAFALRREPDAAARYSVAGALRDLAVPASATHPGLAGLDAELLVTDSGGWLAFADEALGVSDPERLVEPLALRGLAGTLSWTALADGARVYRAQGLRADVGSTAIEANGSLIRRDGAEAALDLDLAFASSEARDVARLLPRGLLPEKGEHWLRNVFAAGRLEHGRARLRGPLGTGRGSLAALAAAGELSLAVDLVDCELRYASEWPPARGLNGRLAVDSRAVSLAVAAGEIAGASIAGAEVTMPDLFTREREVDISGTARGPAESAARLVRESPLRSGQAARIHELAIDGDIALDLDLRLALYPGGPRDVLGQAHFAGNRIAAPAHGITLDSVTGAVGFTRGDWYGEGLTALFEGTPVGLVVNGGLDDPNYDSEFRMTGSSSAARLLDYLAHYAAPLHGWLERHAESAALDGELPWKAVLTIPRKTSAGGRLPSRLVLESSLQGLAIGLPWPFGKLGSERKPLRIEAAIAERTVVATRIDFGEILDAEITAQRAADGGVRVDRVEVLFGASQPEFSGTPGLSLSGYIARLPLGEWAAVLNGGTGHAQPRPDWPQRFDVQVKELEAVGRIFPDVRLAGTLAAGAWQVTVSGPATNGSITVPPDGSGAPLRMDFARLELPRRAPVTEGAVANAPLALDPRLLPALHFTSESFRYGATELGRAEIVTRREEAGQIIDTVTFANPDFSLSARGDWLVHDATDGSHFTIEVTSRALASLLERFGYHGGGIHDGRTRILIDATWAGAPSDFTLDRMSGTFELHVTDGRLTDIEPGSGRLFGLLSLHTLPRRLSLDFDDLFQKGFAFDNIDGMFEIEAGNAYTNRLLMEGPSARIDVSGRTGLGAKDYDQRVVVTPALANTLPAAGALFGPIGAGAGAVYFIGQKMFKSLPEQINRLLSREYAVTGTWDDPKIERL